MRIALATFVGFGFLAAVFSARAEDDEEFIPLIQDDGLAAESALETFLAPGEFPGRKFEYTSQGQEAIYSIDSSLSASEPFAELHPERLPWPRIAGLKLIAESPPLKLKPVSDSVDDDVLDEGFFVRWILKALGQRFEPTPHFAAAVVEAEVIAEQDGRRLFFWQAPPSPVVCKSKTSAGHPNCDLSGVSREVKAMALSPDGKLLALAIGGIRPRLEVYNVAAEPRLAWQSLFAVASGGAVEVAFSADGEWVVAFTGRGRMHRFDAETGGRHMSIPSAGRAARAIPPGRVLAVAGEAGEVNLWYLADGTIAWRLPPRKLRGPIDRLAASGDGRRFATLEYDEEKTLVRVWEIKRRAMLAQVEVDPYAVADIALDHTGRTLFVTHEKKGLLSAVVDRKARLVEVGGENGARCRGRLRWIPKATLLSCSVPHGELQMDSKGRVERELVTQIDAGDWIVAASAGGRRLAAIGDGHLLIWWIDKK
ncbi:MAG: WD40 repeat domain-containing protein [Deltaproteobacteria bacterium]|nr:WD40 repeat domain-containing protein [Deltaproteobacteria bacterium]